ncbi:unnamed protein product [Calicophoron daubneyi]|uniref:Protein KTI12 homolog n=1 Tax=Calicophoron daubneyi TaxID=300641 RepID=A0AAV2U0A4_CALDB
MSRIKVCMTTCGRPNCDFRIRGASEYPTSGSSSTHFSMDSQAGPRQNYSKCDSSSAPPEGLHRQLGIVGDRRFKFETAHDRHFGGKCIFEMSSFQSHNIPKRFSVPSAPISVAVSSTPDDLNKLLKELLKESGTKCDNIEFAFIIGEEFLLGILEDHLSDKQITAEIIEVEYCEKQKPPVYTREINQDDLISSVRRREQYILTGSYDGTVHAWSLNDDSPAFRLELKDKVKCVEWLTLGQSQATFVTGGFDQSAQLWVWDMKSGNVTCAAACRGHSETVMTIASQCPRSSTTEPLLFATGSWDCTIKLWSADPKPTDLTEETGGIAHIRKSTNTPTRVPRMTLAGHRETVTRVCWLQTTTKSTSESSNQSTSSKLISVSWDHTLRAWDCLTGSQEKGGTETRSVVSSHAFNDADAAPQGILTASSDNRVRIYDLRAQEALALVGFQGHAAWLTSVAWAPHRDNHFVTGSIDRSVRLWDTRNLKASLYDLMGHTDMVTNVDWAPAVDCPKSGGDTPQHYILSSSADAIGFHQPSTFLDNPPMPLLIVCGYPCSGKSSVVKHIVLNLQLRFPQFVVKVVPEPVPPSGQDFGDDVRKDIYADSKKERELRGQHKSEVERTLTLPIEDTKNQGNRALVVLMDAGNYIKGYRYELYCLAKSLKHQHCVIYCDTPLEKVIEWNARINRYPDTLLKDMISRFEAPQASQRWDRPLISLNPSLWPSADEINVDSVMNELTDLVFTPGGASVRPNRSTQLPVLCPTEFLQVFFSYPFTVPSG